jgi:hypothetical protein
MKGLLALLLIAPAVARLAPTPVKASTRASSALAKSGGFSYGEFARNNAGANGIIIGGIKTGAADAMAQFATPGDFDFKRNVRAARVPPFRRARARRPRRPFRRRCSRSSARSTSARSSTGTR